MKICIPFLFLAIILLVSCTTQDDHFADLKSDIDFLRDSLPAKHPNLFFHISQEEFNQSLEAIQQKLPQYNELEVNMALRQAIANIGDPHTNFGFYDILDKKGFFPIEIFWLADGIWITGADKQYASLIGQKILAINGHPIETVVKKVSKVVPENEPYFSHKRMHHFLLQNGILEYYGITDGSSAEFTLESPEGETQAATVNTVVGEYNVDIFQHQKSMPFFWQSVMTEETDLIFRQKYFEEDSILFIQYNSCWGKELEEKYGDKEEAKTIPSFEEFQAGIFDAIAEKPVKKVLFDLRFNGGGSSPQGTRLVEALSRQDDLNQKGKIFVAISQHTFSSAVINAMNFRQMTNAILVGMPTGGSPNHYGEVRTLVLPKTGLEVYHSTNYFEYVEEDLKAVDPDVVVEMEYAELLKGFDPIYEYVKKH